MSNIGYINTSHFNGLHGEALNKMNEYGCSTVYREHHRRERPEWNRFISSLTDGDSAVLYAFDNAFCNFNDMIFFIKYCSKMNIRIVSLADRLDTWDELFKDSKTANTLSLICRIFGKRDKTSHEDVESELYSQTFADRRLKRYGLVINMYKAGYSAREIIERTGYRSRATVYNILRNNDIEVDHTKCVKS